MTRAKTLRPLRPRLPGPDLDHHDHRRCFTAPQHRIDRPVFNPEVRRRSPSFPSRLLLLTSRRASLCLLDPETAADAAVINYVDDDPFFLSEQPVDATRWWIHGARCHPRRLLLLPKGCLLLRGAGSWNDD
ncbi:uncharacterized protein [Triticum aestivum]|uniref:uncharacterized protein n=1 Tax=Triticum aestivum TaxID=4565 RepID=UPI001D0242B4|nr:uncharacterized protein LOC123121323 [Triticum aestivum]